MLPFEEAWTGSLIHRRSDTLFPALRLASVPVLRAFYRDGHERFFDNNAVTMCFDYSAGEQNRNEDTNQNERSEHVCLPY